MVGIHTPEFDRERSREAVREAVEHEGLGEHAHLLDNDYAYWNALGNQYWPTLYLVDRCGRLRYRHVGEAHAGEASGQRLEAAAEALLAEPAGECAGH